jgi:WD domain, G-beta repeat
MGHSMAEDNNDDSSGKIYYDDFLHNIGDEDRGPSRTSSAALQGRMETLREQEQRTDARTSRNWQKGFWTVRGFSLDPYEGDDEYTVDLSHPERNPRLHGLSGTDQYESLPSSTKEARVEVCAIVPCTAYEDRVWIGRTSGELVYVQLGTDQWTKFRQKLSARMPGDQEDTATPIVVDRQWVREEQRDPGYLKDLLESRPPLDDDASPRSADPFVVVAQGHSHSQGLFPITAIWAQDHLVFSAVNSTAPIQKWEVQDDEDGTSHAVLNAVSTLDSDGAVHRDAVIFLQGISEPTQEYFPDDGTSEREPSMLVSASVDGVVALWDIKTGRCRSSFRIVLPPVEDAQGNVLPPGEKRLVCAVSDGRNTLFLGTSTGYVQAYRVIDILASPSQPLSMVPTIGQWVAAGRQGSAVTAIAFGGPGSIGRGRTEASSQVLITGDADGLVRQWEVIARSIENTGMVATATVRLEQWPKLATQKMPKKAHLFRGHEGPVTAVLSIDPTKFISAGSEGTIRVWNPTTGQELFQLDGFTSELKSLCLQDENLLLSDGMRHLVCVNDFNFSQEDDHDGIIDLDW